jgi:hypothetical protein
MGRWVDGWLMQVKTAVITEAIESMPLMAQQHQDKLVTQAVVDLQRWVNADYIAQALTNLLSNNLLSNNLLAMRSNALFLEELSG